MAEIRVFAKFPLDADPTHSCWDWIHCLTFPLDTLNELQFTPKPYKWMRYVTGVVVGAQGHFSLGRDSPQDVIDYNHDLPSMTTTLYYHISDDEKEKMFPADPDMDWTSTTGSAASSRRVGSRDDVIQRDGMCVLTGFRAHNCEVTPLLPHRKGDEYIETYTQRRSRDPDGKDIVRDMDDVRNGILLNRIGRCNFGKTFAFLMTPNFAMNTADVDLNAPSTERRCTMHLFVQEDAESLGDRALRSGALVRMPHPADKWPPDSLFDAAYANAVLRQFVPKTMLDELKQWNDIFCPEGIVSAATREERTTNVREQRATRRADGASRARDHLDYFDYLMILPYIRVPSEKQQAIWRKAAEERAERERSHLEDKVGSWAREVANVGQ